MLMVFFELMALVI